MANSKKPIELYNEYLSETIHTIESYEKTIKSVYIPKVKDILYDDYNEIKGTTPNEIIQMFINKGNSKDILQIDSKSKVPYFFNNYGLFINLKLSKSNGTLIYPKITYYVQLLTNILQIPDKDKKDTPKEVDKFNWKIRPYDVEIFNYFKGYTLSSQTMKQLSNNSMLNFVCSFIIYVSFVHCILKLLNEYKDSNGTIDNNSIQSTKESKSVKKIALYKCKRYSNILLEYYNDKDEVVELTNPIFTFKFKMDEYEAKVKNFKTMEPSIYSLNGKTEIKYRGSRLNRENVQEYFTKGSLVSFDVICSQIVFVAEKTILTSVVKKFYIKRYEHVNQNFNEVNNKLCNQLENELGESNKDDLKECDENNNDNHEININNQEFETINDLANEDINDNL